MKNNSYAQKLVDDTSVQQIRAADPTNSVWASANAGAGKTKVLIDRIARLLLAGSPPDKILAVTYTKAAAAEMTSRLFTTLGEWAVSKDKDLQEKLRKLDPAKEHDLPVARALFARALETPGGLKIETIHAFCGTILKRFPLEAGIAPGFEVVEDIAAAVLAARAFENVAQNDMQLMINIAARSFGEKHQDLIRTAANFIHNDTSFDLAALDKKLLLQFDLDENDNEEAAIIRALSHLDNDLLGECAAILEDNTKETGNDIKAARIMRQILITTDIEAFETALQLILTKKGKTLASSLPTSKYVNNPAIVRLFGPKVQKDEDWIGGQLAKFWHEAQKAQGHRIRSASLDIMRAVSLWKAAYKTLKQQSGKLDFADLLIATSRLLNRPNGGALWVLYKLDQGLSHVLIDESQDTSAEQWELLTPLLDALESENYDQYAKGPRTRFVVGDEKQSIYSFQGASPERFGQEREKFINDKLWRDNEFSATRISVPFDVSFRTGQKILDAVDRVWANVFEGVNLDINDPELEKKFFAERKHHSARAGQESQVELWPLESKAAEAKIVEPWYIPLNAQKETSAVNLLASRIAREIKVRIENCELVWDKDENNRPYSRPIREADIMILVKQRKDLFHSIIRSLKRENLKVAGSDLIVLTQEPAILDLIALGRFVLRPEDDFNLACVLKGAFCGLVNDDEHLFPLAYDRGRDSLWQRLRQNENPIYANAKAFLIAQTKRFEDTSAFEFFGKLLETYLPDGRIGWHAMFERFGQEVREPIEVFLDIALKADSLGALDIAKFLDIIEFQSTATKRDLSGENEGIQVMTVHGAKGREAPIVILPDTSRSISVHHNNLFHDTLTNCVFWTPQIFYEPKIITELKENLKAIAEAEDKRLLYVAMTRARDRLILCGHVSGNGKFGRSDKSWYASFEDALPSLGKSNARPLCQIGEQSLDTMNTASVWGENIKPTPQTNQRAELVTSVPNMPAWMHQKPKQEEGQNRRIAPSSFLLETEEQDAASPISGQNQHRFLRGRLIHELLENIPKIQINAREKWAKAKLIAAKSLNDEERDEILSHAFEIVDNEKFSAYFAENSRAEVSILGKAKTLPEGVIISGTIDRLIVGEKEILVLDFKTNRPPPTETSKISMAYVKQMAIYQALLHETYPAHTIKCALLWTDTPILMEIPQEMLDAAIKALK